MGRRCDELAESGSRDFCFSTRGGFGSLAEEALPLNNASSLSILHRLLGTGLGSLASPIGGAAENAGSSVAGAPCAANMRCGEFRCLLERAWSQTTRVYSHERVHLDAELLIRFISNNSAACNHAHRNGIRVALRQHTGALVSEASESDGPPGVSVCRTPSGVPVRHRRGGPRMSCADDRVRLVRVPSTPR